MVIVILMYAVSIYVADDGISIAILCTSQYGALWWSAGKKDEIIPQEDSDSENLETYFLASSIDGNESHVISFTREFGQ